MIHIREQIWGTKSIGIAVQKISIGQKLVVKIDYVDKYGNELHPYYLMMDGVKALHYPSQTIKGTVLKIIPIDDFTKMVTKEDIKYKIHRKLEQLYSDKDKQYSVLKRETGKSHVEDLKQEEAKKFFSKLERNRIVPEEVWKLI